MKTKDKIFNKLLDNCRTRGNEYNMHKQKLSAAVVYRNRILVTGKNSYKTHPLQAQFASKTTNPHRIHLHAEIDAIIKLMRLYPDVDMQQCELYVARTLANGKPGLACPCSSCWAAIEEMGISKVYWTTNSEKIDSIDMITAMPAERKQEIIS